MSRNCQLSDIPLWTPEEVVAAVFRPRRTWQKPELHNVSREVGVTVAWPMTSWLTTSGPYTVEHVAGADANGDLHVFWWSPRAGRWQAVNASGEAGPKVTGSVTSWLTTSGPYTVEHVAGADANGDLHVFWWSPRAGRWQAVNASGESWIGPDAAEVAGVARLMIGVGEEVLATRTQDGGLPIFWWTSALAWQTLDLLDQFPEFQCRSDPVGWVIPWSSLPERLAFNGTSGLFYVMRGTGLERDLTDAIRQPAFSLKRMRNVRRKVLAVLWDPHKPGITRPEKSAVEDALFGPTDSVRAFYLENSGGLFTIENAGVLGWFDADYPPSEYWPGGGQAGRDSGAEAIRKAAKEVDFRAWDSNRDGNLTADELGIVFILPGTGDGGGLTRVVGEDYTTRDTAKGITVDDVKISWISEVSIGSPPGPGIVAHELGHLLLGHGDMYFTFFTPTRASAYSLMDQDGKAPHIDPFGKLKLGWLRPRLVFSSGRYALPDVETNHTALILLDSRHGIYEYFIVENRWPGSSFDEVLPDRGLAVWHIMESPATYDSALPPPNVNPSTWASVGMGAGAWSRKAIRMVRPLVTSPLNDGMALWDGSDPATGFDLLSDDPDPSHGSLKWGDGTPSGFALVDIPPAGPDVEVRVFTP